MKINIEVEVGIGPKQVPPGVKCVLRTADDGKTIWENVWPSELDPLGLWIHLPSGDRVMDVFRTAATWYPVNPDGTTIKPPAPSLSAPVTDDVALAARIGYMLGLSHGGAR